MHNAILFTINFCWFLASIVPSYYNVISQYFTLGCAIICVAVTNILRPPKHGPKIKILGLFGNGKVCRHEAEQNFPCNQTKPIMYYTKYRAVFSFWESLFYENIQKSSHLGIHGLFLIPKLRKTIYVELIKWIVRLLS